MHDREFFPAVLFLPIFYSFNFRFNAVFFYFLYSFTKMKACTVCANAQGIYFYGLLAIQSLKSLNCWTSLNDISEQVVKSKDFRRQTKEWMAVFLVKCVRNIIEKGGSICITILQHRKVKKIQLHNFKVSSATVWRYMTNKGWKALKRKRRRTCNLVHWVLSYPA